MPPNLHIYVDPACLDYEWLFRVLSTSYWGAHYTKQQLLRAIDRSVIFGAYVDGKQIGFARVITDYATASLLNDVIVDEAWRGMGVGTKLMEAVVAHPAVAPTIIVLQTRRAHGLYQKFGFMPLGEMFKRDPR